MNLPIFHKEADLMVCRNDDRERWDEHSTCGKKCPKYWNTPLDTLNKCNYVDTTILH